MSEAHAGNRCVVVVRVAVKRRDAGVVGVAHWNWILVKDVPSSMYIPVHMMAPGGRGLGISSSVIHPGIVFLKVRVRSPIWGQLLVGEAVRVIVEANRALGSYGPVSARSSVSLLGF